MFAATMSMVSSMIFVSGRSGYLLGKSSDRVRIIDPSLSVNQLSDCATSLAPKVLVVQEIANKLGKGAANVPHDE